MMSLPKFTDPHPSIEKLWEEQARLKRQADKMMASTGILKLLSKYGTLSDIGGSYSYDLMVYPDLDVDLTSAEADTLAFGKMVGELVATQYVRKISTANTVDFTAIMKDRPKGYWVGLEIPFKGDRWGIDSWLQRPEWVSDRQNSYGDRLKALDQPGRDAVLLIKYDLIRRGLYGKTVLSNNVYDAVLNDGVRSVAEFDRLILTETD